MLRNRIMPVAVVLVSAMGSMACTTVWSHDNPAMLGDRFDYELAACERYARDFTYRAGITDPLLQAASVQSFTEDCMEKKGYRATQGD